MEEDGHVANTGDGHCFRQDPNPGPEGARWQVSARFWKQTEVGGVTKAEGSGIVSSNP